MAQLVETETEWQQKVIQLAQTLGWKHLHVRRSIGRGKRWVTATNVIGWPDLFMWHERQQRVLVAELKSPTGTLAAEQAAVLVSLAAAGIETYVWRPVDLDEIVKTLGGRAARR